MSPLLSVEWNSGCSFRSPCLVVGKVLWKPSSWDPFGPWEEKQGGNYISSLKNGGGELRETESIGSWGRRSLLLSMAQPAEPRQCPCGLTVMELLFAKCTRHSGTACSLNDIYSCHLPSSFSSIVTYKGCLWHNQVWPISCSLSIWQSGEVPGTGSGLWGVGEEMWITFKRSMFCWVLSCVETAPASLKSRAEQGPESSR